MCFWPGICWGMGAVLCFDTHTLTITSRGFYTVFGHTPDSVRNFYFIPERDVGPRICTLHPADQQHLSTQKRGRLPQHPTLFRLGPDHFLFYFILCYSSFTERGGTDKGMERGVAWTRARLLGGGTGKGQVKHPCGLDHAF